VKKKKKAKRRDPYALPAKVRRAGPFRKKRKVKHKKKIMENDE